MRKFYYPAYPGYAITERELHTDYLMACYDIVSTTFEMWLVDMLNSSVLVEVA